MHGGLVEGPTKWSGGALIEFGEEICTPKKV